MAAAKPRYLAKYVGISVEEYGIFSEEGSISCYLERVRLLQQVTESACKMGLNLCQFAVKNMNCGSKPS